MGKLLNDEGFKHISYHATDLRKTFARIRREQREKAEADKRKPLATIAKINRGVK